MKSLISIYLLLFLTSCLNNSLENGQLLIHNVAIINLERGLMQNQNVLISDGKILKISASTGPIPKARKGSQIIDGNGLYLIPGLWDFHIHMTYEPLLAEDMFSLFLQYGVTSVRDTGGKLSEHLKWETESVENPENSPHYFYSGPLLDGSPLIYDGSSPRARPLGIMAETPVKVLRVADSLRDAGVDFLKAYEHLSEETFIRLGSFARSHNLPLTGHIPLSMDLIHAVEAGMTSMEHLRNVEMACSGEWESLLEQRKDLLLNIENKPGLALRRSIHLAQRARAIATQDADRTEQVLNVIADNHTWQTPTLSIVSAMTERPWLDSTFQKSFNDLPDTLTRQWKSVIANLAESPINESDQQYADYLFNMTASMHKKGIPIMAGTDCPIFFLTPGYSLHHELQLLAKSGLPNLEVLKAATLSPAQYFGIEEETGSIAMGKVADLVLLRANPLEDIHNTTTIDKVIKGGKIVFSNEP